MFARVTGTLERLFASSQTRLGLRSRTAGAERTARLALETLEDRLAQSHLGAALPHVVPGPITIEPFPLPPVHGHPTPAPPTIGVPTPGPKPSPVQPPVGGHGSGVNPATYVPALCTTASFSGTLGPDGHYSSFTIVGHNPATGTTVIISYSTGTPYGIPVYHWAVTVESQLLGNWGNQCTVYQPYYADFLPLPVTYHQPGYGPG
jgi:hypothetical protein